ncbi:AraC family transcriptional regulator [Phyllobacterium endophyticum]|uniref:AraC family transcriptional regulator n=1 Tax=Phyllobacterium endophyticum TaxID=1149773 RepID=A0A2P7AP48_9HYPH|nr:AraC family transcriptional regulator [Phyllobacterium endophyticum]MBB3233656.1 AraC-like DNA-binding protein [Phyllobacterium endophyticum]PSH55990.1 AraC family transcriptional regulator [Phyllobacterium endophyticum]TYR41135.1 AraC family transcriptional regulator [Phyllobacterium endophyticum]
MTRLKMLIDIIARHAPHDGTFDGAIPGVKLLRSSTPTMPMPVIYEPTVCFVAQGRKQAALGTTAYIYDPARYLVASVGLPVMGSVIEATKAEPYLSLQLDLDLPVLGELAARHPLAPDEPVALAMGLTLNQTNPAMLDAVVRLASLLDEPRDIEALAPLTISEILYRLLTGSGGIVIRHMTQADSRLSQVARAIVWLRKHFQEACRIEEAAEIAGMSRSSFHQHFRAVTAMSPIEFRTQLRIQEARRLMVSSAMDAASAGFHVGYDSPSQFSRDYSRIFGIPPAKHARRLRIVTTDR